MTNAPERNKEVEEQRRDKSFRSIMESIYQLHESELFGVLFCFLSHEFLMIYFSANFNVISCFSPFNQDFCPILQNSWI